MSDTSYPTIINEWNELKRRRSEFVSYINSKEQDFIDYLIAKGNEMAELINNSSPTRVIEDEKN